MIFKLSLCKSLVFLLSIVFLASCADSADEASQTDPIVNAVPVITGLADPSGELTTIEDTTITITLSDLVVTDQDNDYPADFTLHAQSGLNYTYSENAGNTEVTISPIANYLGQLSVSVTVNDGENSSAVFSVPVNVVENVAAIPAPTLDVITAGDGEITLSWSPVNGASGYYIYYSNNPDFTKRSASRVNAFNATTFTVTGLQNKAVYYFRVAGYDSNDLAGPLSAETLSDFPFKPYSAMNWLHPTSSGHGLWDNIWANNKYIAVGTTGRILTSANGTNWAIQNSGTTEDIRAVAASGNRFIAVGYKNTILLSTDATASTWTSVQNSLSANASFSRVLWNGSQFVILAYDSST
ncbi:fibronectin type III domain-containing protein, partial [Kaarinaea lacus]